MPAHDLRHAAYKVPAAALTLLSAANITGIHRLGVLGALAHDYGRWAEERLFGGPTASVFHARLSFLLLREILAQYPIPHPVQNELLSAVLGHTTGALPQDSLIAQLTVTADRAQLVGPEIILRLVHHCETAITGTDGHFLAQPELAHHSVTQRLWSLAWTRQPGPLQAYEAERVQQSKLNMLFVLMCEAPGVSQAWHAQLSQRQTQSIEWARGASLLDWQAEAERHLAQEVERPVEESLAGLLTAPGVASAPKYMQATLTKLRGLAPAQLSRISRALSWATRLRARLDALEQGRLQQMQAQVEEPYLQFLLKEIGARLGEGVPPG